MCIRKLFWLYSNTVILQTVAVYYYEMIEILKISNKYKYTTNHIIDDIIPSRCRYS